MFSYSYTDHKALFGMHKTLGGGEKQRERERRGGGRGSSYCTPFSIAFSFYTENKGEEIRVKWGPAVPTLDPGSHQTIFRTLLQGRMLGPPCLGFKESSFMQVSDLLVA